MSRRERPPTLTREDRRRIYREMRDNDPIIREIADTMDAMHVRQTLDHLDGLADYIKENIMQAHEIGATVCTPGRRYPLTVVAFDQAVATSEAQGVVHSVYTIQDEANPAIQPFPAYRVPARDVKAYGWRALLRLSTPDLDGDGLPDKWELDRRSHYLDACAHLHDLGDHDNADELLNEAAQRWFEKCATPECDDGKGPQIGWDELTDGTSEPYCPPCTDCNGTGRVSRITDAHRLRLVECLIAAGLPARAVPKPRGRRRTTVRYPDMRPGTEIGDRIVLTDGDLSGHWEVAGVTHGTGGTTLDLVEPLVRMSHTPVGTTTWLSGSFVARVP